MAALDVLPWVAGAALAAGLGPLLQRGVGPPSDRVLGWANAVAGGLMFGVAYGLAVPVLESDVVRGGLGAALGVAFVHLTHVLGRTFTLRLNRVEATPSGYGRRIFVIHALHSTSEGLALGVAWLFRPALGVIVAIVLAVHNIAEALVLGAVVRGRGVGAWGAVIAAVASNVPQVLMAVGVVLMVTPGGPDPVAGLVAVAGFAVGALVHLVLVELLPEAYAEAGPASIAVITSLATGAAVFARLLSP